MDGAFPLEDCVAERRNITAYRDFHVSEEEIDFAEGIIAIASYSMPHAARAISRTNGFPLGGLRNEDLVDAYGLLRNEDLLSMCSVPEPTGIVSLAAAMKHKHRFSKNDRLMLCFTGHGAKDPDELVKLLGTSRHSHLVEMAVEQRPDIVPPGYSREIGLNQSIDQLLGLL